MAGCDGSVWGAQADANAVMLPSNANAAKRRIRIGTEEGLLARNARELYFTELIQLAPVVGHVHVGPRGVVQGVCI